MNLIEIISRTSFLVLGTFHFFYNWVIFEINYVNGIYVWKVNINSIGEAQFEAWMMIVLMPFFIAGLFYFINDFKKVYLTKNIKVEN